MRLAWIDGLREEFPALNVREGVMLREYTTFRIGGPADVLASPADIDELVSLCGWARAHGVPVTVLGGGSNVLVSDNGVRGLVIHTAALAEVTAPADEAAPAGEAGAADASLTALCGAKLAKAAMTAYHAGLAGLAFAHGIPGTVGGAVVMNAGAYGGEMSQVVSSTEYLTPDGRRETLDAAGHGFGYRSGFFSRHPECVILRVHLRLTPGRKAAIKSEMDGFDARRREKQPLMQPSAGSVFKRPEGRYAGALIEECGLKGYASGGAQVSEKHAGFIVNRGGATCRDVLTLIGAIQKSVHARAGVMLEPEIRVIGEEP